MRAPCFALAFDRPKHVVGTVNQMTVVRTLFCCRNDTTSSASLVIRESYVRETKRDKLEKKLALRQQSLQPLRRAIPAAIRLTQADKVYARKTLCPISSTVVGIVLVSKSKPSILDVDTFSSNPLLIESKIVLVLLIGWCVPQRTSEEIAKLAQGGTLRTTATARYVSSLLMENKHSIKPSSSTITCLFDIPRQTEPSLHPSMHIVTIVLSPWRIFCLTTAVASKQKCWWFPSIRLPCAFHG